MLLGRKLWVGLAILFSSAVLISCGPSVEEQVETAAAQTAAAATSTPTILAECVASLVPGSSTVTCEGLDYDLGIPEECFATPCGLIVDYHPSGVTAEQTDALTNMTALGNAAGYVVVQPHSLFADFGAGMDRIFFDALIGALDIDVSRVHMGGASLGGSQVWRFVCDHSDLFASAAILASDGVSCDSEDNRLPAEQVDILYFHGRKDGNVPFARGVAQLEFVIESWDMTASEVLADEPTYQWTRWTNEQGTVLEFIEFDWTNPRGNGHCYPGADAGIGGCGIDTPIHYGEAALNFYIAHPKDA